MKYSHHQTKYIGKQVGLRTCQHSVRCNVITQAPGVSLLYYRFTSPINRQQFRGLQQSVFIWTRYTARILVNFTFCWPCISIHLYNKNQLDILYILSLFNQSTSYTSGIFVAYHQEVYCI